MYAGGAVCRSCIPTTSWLSTMGGGGSMFQRDLHPFCWSHFLFFLPPQRTRMNVGVISLLKFY